MLSYFQGNQTWNFAPFGEQDTHRQQYVLYLGAVIVTRPTERNTLFYTNVWRASGIV